MFTSIQRFAQIKHLPIRRFISAIAIMLLANNVVTPIAVAQSAAEDSAPKRPAKAKPPNGIRRHNGAHRKVVSKSVLPMKPTDEELMQFRFFEEPLLPISTQPVKGESEALRKAIDALVKQPDRLDSLRDFVKSYPRSRWTPAAAVNLGIDECERGMLSLALEDLTAAWQLSKARPEGKRIADRALGELALLKARLGRTQELESLFAEIKGRPLDGSVQQQINAAREGLVCMTQHPEVSFKCGPYAVNSILQRQNPQEKGLRPPAIQEFASTHSGSNLEQLEALSREVGLNLVPAKRTAGGAVVVPSVMHWKVGHFAAITDLQNGKYRVTDPTFSADGKMWLTPEVIDSESDGYFLVPKDRIPSGGWTLLSDAEAGRVWGRGGAEESNEDAMTPYAPKSCPSGGAGLPMAVSSFFLMNATMNLHDVPLGYSPPVGPEVSFHVNYNYLETHQPTTFTFTNMGQNWTLNYVSYLTKDASDNIAVRVPGGGTENFFYTGNSSAPYYRDMQSQALIVSTGTDSYERRMPDGSKQVYDIVDGAGRVFMSSIVDPQGNAISLDYDTDFRLTTVTDALGQDSTITYLSNTSSNPGFYKVSQIADPFSRTCSFTYDSSSIRLLAITDLIGISSQFEYDETTGQITQLTTPYGRTRFYQSFSEEAASRTLRITYPDNTSEVITRLLFVNHHSYHWDRHAMALYPFDADNAIYAHATKYGWLKQNDSAQTLSPIMNQFKPALETETTYTFTNQGDNYVGIHDPQEYIDLAPGTINKPITSTRTVPGGTQETSATYNVWGLVTSTTDPIGREFSYSYDTNGIDLTEVRETKGTDNYLLGKWTYNSQHLPTSFIDSSGNKTSYVYNGAGQLTSVTDANGATTEMTYDLDGYLTEIDGPLSGSADVTTFDYDGYGRVYTVTNSEGYVLTYSYDNADRVTAVTYPDGTANQIKYHRLDAVLFKDRINRWSERAFNSMRELTQERDPLGRLTQYEWCSCGSLLNLTDPADHVTHWDHDLQGRVTSKVYADTTHVDYTYDTAGRLSTRTDALDQVTTYGYNLDDSLASIEYSNEVNATSDVDITYDANFNRVATVENGWGTITYGFNPHISDATAVGNIWLSGLPATGDKINVVVHNSNLSGGKHNVQYTVQSTDTTLATLAASLESAIDSDTALSTLSFAASHNSSHVFLTAPSTLGTISVVPSANGDATATISGSATVSDTVSITVHDAGLTGGSKTKTYTVASGNTLSSIASGLASLINGDTDLQGIDVSATASSATITLSSSSENETLYSASNSVGSTATTSITGGANEAATSGGGGRLASESNDVIANSKITYAYDSLGRQSKRMINGNANAIHWVYDTMSRVTAEFNALGRFAYSYVDDTSLSKGTTELASVNYPNGQVTNYSRYANSGDRRLQTINNLKPDSTQLSRFDYTYNAAGEITQWEQQQNGADIFWHYEYDDAGQLITAQTRSGAAPPPYADEYYYNYDLASNRVGEQINTQVRQSTYNNVNQITGIAAGGPTRFQATTNKAIKSASVTIGSITTTATLDTSKSFHANPVLSPGTNSATVAATDGGNNTVSDGYEVDVDSGSSPSFTFDDNGNMTSDGTNTYAWDAENRLIEVVYPGSGNRSEFSYDPEGLRSCISEWSAGALTARTFLVTDGLIFAEQRDESGDIEQCWFGKGECVGEELFFTTHDHLASVREITNVSAGIESQSSYMPFGQQVEITGSGQKSKWVFAGQFQHERSGLYLSVFRAYHPAVGGWVSRDPLGESADLALYRYASNNPVGHMDALGLCDPCKNPKDLACRMKSELNKRPNLKAGVLGAIAGAAAAMVLGPVAGGFAAGAARGAAGAAAGAAGGGGLGASAGAMESGAAASASGGLARLASQFSNIVESGGSQAGYRTYAMTNTAEGVQIFSASRGGLNPAQRALINEGQLIAPSAPGVDAEVAGVQYARELGLTPTEQLASRVICPSCNEFLTGQGASMVAGRGAVWPRP